MRETESLSSRDLRQLSGLGISAAEIQRQLDLFKRPPPPVQLLRPCRPGDGITRLSQTEQDAYVDNWRSLAHRHRLAKFVPASGAATRMFKDLNTPTSSQSADSAGSRLLESLPRFAFFDALKAILASQGRAMDSLVERGEVEPIRQALMDSSGLNYGDAPKGLILFHPSAAAEPRSALEEQLWEGCGYLTSSEGACRFHFTVTGDHEDSFREQLERFRHTIESRLGVTLEISFSTQNPDTDTVAVSSDRELVRQTDGTLLLRPAGHGALLKNLESVDADIVFIKNIDNVAHERLHPVAIHWKRVLAGYFADIQTQIFASLSEMDRQPDARKPVDRALEVLRSHLAVEVPTEILDATHQIRIRYLLDRLDRPLRVCGMVKNEGEPGGGPFWLRNAPGGAAGQIVESAQVDLTAPGQTEIWGASTHFNPVDLVCGLRDRNGRPYALANFVDPATSFVADKSHAGQPIKALERPGLWNGGMALWNTAFVEVPLQTFTPVKMVFDLLRPEHQP